MTKPDEAFRMLDAFTSVGADSFVVTKTDILQTVKWGKPYTVPQLREQLPAMVRTAAIRRPCKAPEGDTFLAGENLIFRPSGKGVAFLQLDDLAADKLEQVRPAAFLIHATSPGSYQAWIAVSGLPEGKEPFKVAAELEVSPIMGAPVPEASTWAMLLLGLGGFGVVAGRRRLGAALWPNLEG